MITDTLTAKDLQQVPVGMRDPVRFYTSSRHTLFEYDEGMCWLCENPASVTNWSQDHIIVHSRAGETCFENSKVAHKICNATRGDDMSFIKDVEITEGPRGYKIPVDKDAIEVPKETVEDFDTIWKNYLNQHPEEVVSTGMSTVTKIALVTGGILVVAAAGFLVYKLYKKHSKKAG